MKNVRNGARQGLFKTLLLFALLASATASHSLPSLPLVLEDQCTGSAPTNLQITSQGSNYVSFSWDGVGAPDQYKIWYIERNSSYQSQDFFTANEFIGFMSLPAGNYEFYFAAIHGSEPSSCIIISDLIME
ncbi:MAG: fibronectin type III domain-containing protein [Saprospiraceae bacterium]